MTQIKLILRQKNGQFKTFIQEFVPYRKRLEYIKLESDIASKYEKPPFEARKNYEDDKRIELQDMQVEFVASLFEDKAVTKDAILDGLDSESSDQIMDIILFRVLGLKRVEVENSDSKKEA